MAVLSQRVGEGGATARPASAINLEGSVLRARNCRRLRRFIAGHAGTQLPAGTAVHILRPVRIADRGDAPTTYERDPVERRVSVYSPKERMRRELRTDRAL